jgi:translation initiation factor 1
MTRLFAGTEFDVPPRCDRCGELETDCQCPPPESVKQYADPATQTAKVRVDQRKHKRKVTVVWGLDPQSNDLVNVLSQLKAVCGAGGSIQDERLEIQGDHVMRVKEKLREIGFRVS